MMFKRTIPLILAMAFVLFADSGAGLRWTPPQNWKSEAPRPMRLTTYSVPHAAGDADNGECGVYYFGAGQGGSVEANLDRWIGQFLQADGKPAKQVAKVGKRVVHSMKITTVDVSGAYTGMAMGQTGAPKPGYRLLGAIVEGPQESIFFKFTGPAKTVAQNQTAFDAMLASIGNE
jgi:hypothetical protein